MDPAPETTLSAEQFKGGRKKLALRLRELAEILGVAVRTVQRWEDPDDPRPPNPTASRVLAWMEAGFRPPEWPERLRGR